MLTIGHGTHPITEFVTLLTANGVRRLVDVRAFPRSRHNPQFNQEELERSLTDAGVAYAWEKRLGGRRQRTAADSLNVSLRHPAFRAYADYMLTDGFWDALDGVLSQGRALQSALMCSESVWWRCHRRLISDALVLLRKVPVEHVMTTGKRVEHVPTDGVRVDGERLVYDV